MGTAVRETGLGQGGGAELKGGSRSVSRGSREKLGFISRARGTVARGQRGKGRGGGGGAGRGGEAGERARCGRMEGETP